MLELIILCTAGFAAGLLNAVAGGGTFLTFPALVWAGLPVVSANATATLVALPGYISSAWGFRDDMQAEGSLGLKSIYAIACLGAVIGALLLIVTPNEIFSGVVPWLLMLATVLFGASQWILAFVRKRGFGDAGPLVSLLTLGTVSIYGGYFNGGLGIMLLAAFSLLGWTNLHGMNGLKNVLSAILSLISAVTCIIAGLIVWKPALIMMVFSTLGGYVGAAQSRKIKRTDLLRLFVTGVGGAMTLAFFLA
jgi:uncharacterized membrane protein YfcA